MILGTLIICYLIGLMVIFGHMFFYFLVLWIWFTRPASLDLLFYSTSMINDFETQLRDHSWIKSNKFGHFEPPSPSVRLCLIQVLQRYWNFISFFYVLTCITSLRYLSITCNAFIACYIMWRNILSTKVFISLTLQAAFIA